MAGAFERARHKSCASRVRCIAAQPARPTAHLVFALRMPTRNRTTTFVHDMYGNIIAELTTAGATGLVIASIHEKRDVFRAELQRAAKKAGTSTRALPRKKGR